MDGDLEARADVEEAGTVTGEEEEGEGHMETTPEQSRLHLQKEPQMAPDLPKGLRRQWWWCSSGGRASCSLSGRVQPPVPHLQRPSLAAKDCAESATTATASSRHPVLPPLQLPPPQPHPHPQPQRPKARASQSLSMTRKILSSRGLPLPRCRSLMQRIALSSTEPDSEIKIASVTTLGTDSSAVAMETSTAPPLSLCAQEDTNLMITNVTSLKGEGSPAARPVGGLEGAENGLQISSAFSLNPEAQQNQGTAGRPSSTFNPGRIGAASQPVQNGETGTHQRSGNSSTYICCVVFWTKYMYIRFALTCFSSTRALWNPFYFSPNSIFYVLISGFHFFFFLGCFNG